MMAALCLTESRYTASDHRARNLGASKTESAVISITAGAFLGFAAVILGVAGRGQYGFTLILGTPFAMGALSGFLFNRRYAATLRETIVVATFMLCAVAGVFWLLAFEGALCIAMMLPIGMVLGLLGALMGRAIALWGHRALPPAISAMLLLPIFVAIEPAHLTGRSLHEVQSSVVIDAPPEQVWPHVIAFDPITEPLDLLSRLGIAYPRYAHIEGSGVGAVRYCVFSTGPFVEPITDWEPGQRLGFDVASSPDPLRELSFYTNLSPPHLHGYLRSRRGEFRLIALPGGRTRLEGSTWYEIEIAPEAYWRLWSDYLIHRIHNRVLEHIKLEVESN
jgi:Polyketide cyclase / dehydrase and lipid transport